MAIKNSNLQRWLTGIALGVVLLLIILLGSLELFAAAIMLIIIVGMWEYNSIVFGPGHLKEKTEGLILAVLIPVAVLLATRNGSLLFCLLRLWPYSWSFCGTLAKKALMCLW